MPRVFPPFSLWTLYCLYLFLYMKKPSRFNTDGNFHLHIQTSGRGENSLFSWGVWEQKPFKIESEDLEELPTGFDHILGRNLSLQKKSGFDSHGELFFWMTFSFKFRFLECWYTLPKTDIAPEFWVSAYFWGKLTVISRDEMWSW